MDSGTEVVLSYSSEHKCLRMHLDILSICIRLFQNLQEKRRVCEISTRSASFTVVKERRDTI